MHERLIVWRRADGRWAWRLEESNGRVIAVDGGQGYENFSDCRDMAFRVVSGEYSSLSTPEAVTRGASEVVYEASSAPRAEPLK